MGSPKWSPGDGIEGWSGMWSTSGVAYSGAVVQERMRRVAAVSTGWPHGVVAGGGAAQSKVWGGTGASCPARPTAASSTSAAVIGAVRSMAVPRGGG